VKNIYCYVELSCEELKIFMARRSGFPTPNQSTKLKEN